MLANPFAGRGQFASVGVFLADSEKNSDSTMVLNPSATLNSGNVGVCVHASDNIGTTAGDNNDHTAVSDSDSNVWVQAAEFTNAGNAAAAVTVSVWTTVAGADLITSDTITFTTASDVIAKAAICWEFTTGDTELHVEGATATSETDGGDVPSLASTTVDSAAYLFFRGIGYEGDADTTGLTATSSPTFTSCGVVGTDGGGEAGNIGASCEFIIATATTETSDPAFAGDATVDNATVFPNLEEGAAPAATGRIHVNIY